MIYGRQTYSSYEVVLAKSIIKIKNFLHTELLIFESVICVGSKHCLSPIQKSFGMEKLFHKENLSYSMRWLDLTH